MEESFKSGFVAVIGRPNVGKSTLLNHFLKHKVAIVSEKPQTTRHKIMAVLTRQDAQIIFMDTPGIHKPRHKLGEYMVDMALSSIKEVDLVLFVVEPELPGTGDEHIAEMLEGLHIPVFLVINKTDLVQKPALLPVIEHFRQLRDFAEIIPVSAITEDNLGTLLDEIVRYLPPGPRYYPEGMITDRPEHFIMAEIIREKVLHLTSQEVPHTVAVVIEEAVKRKDDLLAVRAVIFTEKDSQKAIIIGKGGRMLKKVGRLAREEMEAIFDMRTFLDLWVKVRPGWRNQEDHLRWFGYSN